MGRPQQVSIGQDGERKYKVQVYSGDRRCGVKPGGEYDYPLYVIFSADGQILDVSGDKDISVHHQRQHQPNVGLSASVKGRPMGAHSSSQGRSFRLSTQWDNVTLTGPQNRTLTSARKDIILYEDH